MIYRQWTYTDIHEIQVEVTTYCNSYCIGCSRNHKGGPVMEHIPLMTMPELVWDKILDYCEENPIKVLRFNGNYGDAPMLPNLIEFLQKISTRSLDIELRIDTNGGSRTPKFWEDLAITMNSICPTSYIIFSVDGLWKTNHIYRRGTEFENIIANAKAFIKAGGTALWRFIVFDHNKHELNEAANLAKDIGFKAFDLHWNNRKTMEGLPYKDFPYTIMTAPCKEEVLELSKIYNYNYMSGKQVGTYQRSAICPWHNDKRIQIGVDGTVFPCCHYGTEWATVDTSATRKLPKDDMLLSAYRNYGKHFNNLQYYSLQNILQHDFFTSLTNNIEKHTNWLCNDACGIKIKN